MDVPFSFCDQQVGKALTCSYIFSVVIYFYLSLSLSCFHDSFGASNSIWHENGICFLSPFGVISVTFKSADKQKQMMKDTISLQFHESVYRRKRIKSQNSAAVCNNSSETPLLCGSEGSIFVVICGFKYILFLYFCPFTTLFELQLLFG